MSPRDLAIAAALAKALAKKQAKGDRGAPGFKGEPGQRGPSGKDGKDGRDAAPAINGRDGAPGPAGKDGADGTPGPAGPQGEPGVGLPPGGKKGHIPVKASDDDYDIEWKPPVAGGTVYVGGGGGGNGGGGTWGSITGTLSNQTDLQAALDAKALGADLDAHTALTTTAHGGIVASTDPRLTDSRTPTAHASTHTNGTDDIQDATAAQKGLATAAQIAKLDGIAAGAEVNVNADWNAVAGDGLILNKPSSFTPSAHASTHLPNGSDPTAITTLRGLLAARPAASAANLGFLHETTDTNARGVTRSDGSAWNELPLVFRDRVPINVKDYGAVGDGATDDYTAIVAAIAAAPTGGAVYFPPGNYRSSLYIPVAKSLLIYGAHLKQSIITFDAATPYALGANIYVSAYPFSMADLTIDGSYPVGEQHLVRVGPCTSFTIDRCRFTRMKTRSALRANWEGTGGGSAYGHIKVRNTRFDTGDGAGAIAFYTDSTAKGIDGVEVSNCEMVDVGGPCCAILDTSIDTTGSERWGGFVNTKFYGNYILANGSGAWGPIPAELWGHDYLNAFNNNIEAGTRGIGVTACRYGVCNNNTLKNQTLYAFELGDSVGMVFQGNIAIDCRSFIEDTSALLGSTDITIVGNSISGSGLAALDGTARCIKAHYLGNGRNWKVVNNSIKNCINTAKVISLAGAAGGGGHTVKGNTYEATAETATFAFYSSENNDDVCSGNTIRISANYTASNPAYATGNVVIGSSPTVSDVVVSNNDVIFTGSDAGAKLSAFGSLSAPSTGERHTYMGNRCAGAFVFRMSFPTDDAASISDDNLDGGTGTISIPATVIRAQRRARYQASAVPASGGWERGDIIDSSAPAVNAVLRWVNVTSGTPGTWHADYLQGWDGAAGTNRDCNFYTAGVKRAGMRVNSTAESGGDAGSNVSFYVVADNGTTERQWLFVRRTAAGEATLTVNRAGIYPRSATTVEFWIDAWDVNQTSRFDFRSGNTLNWRIQRWATSHDLTLAAYTDAGVLIDTPLTLVKAANGLVTIARPLTIGGVLTTSSARVLKVTSVVTAAGTTVIAATDDVVVFTGTTTQTATLVACATGRRLIIKNRSTGTVTVNRAGSDTIDGATTYALLAGQSITLIGNSTDWVIV